ncbi:MAG TPA: protein kinase [Patescibacteria group bacterium]
MTLQGWKRIIFPDDPNPLFFVISDEAYQAMVKRGMLQMSPDQTLPAKLQSGGPAYIPLKKLDEGGMGIVLVVTDIFGRQVVLKVIKGAATDDKKERFIQEAKLTAGLQHPNIIPVHDLGLRDGHPYFTMKRIYGQSFKQVLEEDRGDYHLSELLRSFLKICEAVAFCHSKEVIHRDLKPANVMIGQFGEVLLMDFGLAKYIGQGEPYFEAINPPEEPEGFIVGSPKYMSPEQAEGRDDVGFPTDVYGLGVILFEILTGTVPFVANDAMSILTKVIRDPAPDPRVLNPAVSKELALITLKAIAKNQADRYQTVEELMADIEAYQDGRDVSVMTYTKTDRVKRYVKRYPGRAIAAVWVMLALTVVGVGFGVLTSWAKREMAQRLVAEKLAREQEELARQTAEEKAEAEERARQEAEKREKIETERRQELEKRTRAFAIYLEAADLHDRFQYQLALDKVNQAIEIDDSFQEAFYLRGMIYQDLNQAAEAIADFQRAFELSRAQGLVLTSALYRVGATYLYLLNDFTRAQEVFVQAEQLGMTDDPFILIMKAHIDVPTGRLAAALDKLDRAAELADHLFEVHFTRGYIYLQYVHRRQLDYLEPAIDAFSQTLKLNYRHLAAYGNRAQLLALANRPEEALADYRTALSMYPDNAQLRYNRGVFHKDSYQFDPAQADFEKALELDQNFALAYDGLGSVYTLRGMAADNQPEKNRFFDQADVWFEEALRRNAPTAYINRGLLRYHQGRPREALDWLERSIQFNPGRRQWIEAQMEMIRNTRED